jgi:hypothetical protein
MMVRRASFNLPKLSYLRSLSQERPSCAPWLARAGSIEDWIFMSVLLVIEITGFLQEATAA